MKTTQFFNLPSDNLLASDLKHWIDLVADHYQVTLEQFVVNFIDKDKMLEMNKKYLDHDTHTDILTFDYGNQVVINAELFISTYMCSLNAEENAQTVENETIRLMSHGFLHTIGYSDKLPQQKLIMTEQEDLCISMFHVKQ